MATDAESDEGGIEKSRGHIFSSEFGSTVLPSPILKIEIHDYILCECEDGIYKVHPIRGAKSLRFEKIGDNS